MKRIHLFILNLIIAAIVIPATYLILWFAVSDKKIIENALPMFVGVSLSITFAIIGYDRRRRVLQ